MAFNERRGKNDRNFGKQINYPLGVDDYDPVVIKQLRALRTELLLLIGGGGAISVQEEGAAVVTASIINFAGANTTVTESPAGVALITILGGVGDWKYNGDTVTAEKSIGTIDNFHLPFIINNLEQMRLTGFSLILAKMLDLPATISAAEGVINFGGAVKIHFFGTDNVFLGGSGNFTLTGTDNIFIGKDAGLTNATGRNNICLGQEAGKSNTDGLHNIFIGSQSGVSAGEGYDNINIGRGSGSFTNGGADNVFIGRVAGYSNTQGQDNIFIGLLSGYSNTQGNRNILLGHSAGYNNTQGEHNVFSGYESGYNNTIGDANVFLGQEAGKSNIDGNYNICIGKYAGNNTTPQGYEISNNGQLFIGASTFPITNVYFNGRTVFTVNGITLNAAGGLGMDIVGGNMTIAGGKSTGSAIVGKVILQTSEALGSGSALQSLVDRVIVDEFDTDVLNNLDINRGLKRLPQIQSVAITLTNISKSLQIVGGAAAFVSYTIDLPTVPENGLVFTFKGNNNLSGGNTVTINGNGKTIEGNATIVLATPYELLTVVFSTSDNIWYAI